jgi:hypothetical protein
MYNQRFHSLSFLVVQNKRHDRLIVRQVFNPSVQNVLERTDKEEVREWVKDLIVISRQRSLLSPHPHYHPPILISASKPPHPHPLCPLPSNLIS